MIQKMGCNYISMLNDGNGYSVNLQNDIIELISANANNSDGICINSFTQFDFNGTNDAQLDIILNEIISLYDNSVNKEDPVIIYIGYKETYSILLNKLNTITLSNKNISNIHIISSEAAFTINYNSNINEKIKIYRVSLNSFDINSYTSLLSYYKVLLQSISTNKTKNIWISEYLRLSYNCSLVPSNNLNSCNINDVDSLPESQYLFYLIYSIFGFFEQLKVTSVQMCPEVLNIDDCQSLSNNVGLVMLTNNLRNAVLKFQYYDLIFNQFRV